MREFESIRDLGVFAEGRYTTSIASVVRKELRGS